MREPVVINWAGGEHPFRLRIGEIVALEERCEAGVGEVFARLASGQGDMAALRFKARDVTEPLRLGLIGGGMDRVMAQKLVGDAADDVGLLALIQASIEVLFTTLSPKAEEPAGDTADDEGKPLRKKTRAPSR